MDANSNIKQEPAPDFPPIDGTVEEAAKVVAGMEHGHVVANNGAPTAVAPTVAPVPPAFCSDDPAAAASAALAGAAMVGRQLAAEMSGGGEKKKRLCRFPGCTKVIKSQGHCQRHGAKAKRCKVEGCDKQAQGTHEGKLVYDEFVSCLFCLCITVVAVGVFCVVRLSHFILLPTSAALSMYSILSVGMCKRHWRAVNFPPDKPESIAFKSDVMAAAPAGAALDVKAPPLNAAALAASTETKKKEPPPAEGTSVYESILPASIAYRPTVITTTAPLPASSASKIPAGAVDGKKPAVMSGSNGTTTTYAGVMPLVAHLKEGAAKHPVGWHRNAERRARGLWPVTSLSTQLEPWERQLALVEILLLSGGTPNANFKDLAHAWGREKGFHNVLAFNVCQRGGATDRKRRSDAGKASFGNKQKQSKTAMTESQAQQQEPQISAATDPPSVQMHVLQASATAPQFYQLPVVQQQMPPQQSAQPQPQMGRAPTAATAPAAAPNTGSAPE